MTTMLPTEFRTVFDSRHLCHLPWEPASTPPPDKKLIIVRGTTGMMYPKSEFLAIGFYDGDWHPKTDHWYDVNNEHFTDQGFTVTHWCAL